MTTWIALLRGVNVGGRRKLPMADLRALCDGLGFRSVATYIQSGNVVFRAEGETPGALARRLETALGERFGLDVTVVVRTREALERAVREQPFGAAGSGGDRPGLHVGFLAEAPSDATLAALPDLPPGREKLRVRGAHAFLLYPDGVGRSKLTTAWLERALGTPITLRNWRTVNRLLEMAREA